MGVESGFAGEGYEEHGEGYAVAAFFLECFGGGEGFASGVDEALFGIVEAVEDALHLDPWRLVGGDVLFLQELAHGGGQR